MNIALNQKINNKIFLLIIFFFISNCTAVGVGSGAGIFGSGVSIALDPRTVGTQIDDQIMQKNIVARLALVNKKYLLSITVKVFDGKVFIAGNVKEAEEKLRITKMAWETKGTRTVDNKIVIQDKYSFKDGKDKLFNFLFLA